MIEKIWNPESISDQLQMMAIRRRRPLSCVLELTYRCNFCCRMCYIRMDDIQASPYGRIRTVEEWLDMGRQLYDAGVLYLTLTGGECTQYPGFEYLYENLSQMGFKISIMSNAGSYNDSIREVFRKYPPWRVGITLYGGCNETYRIVTGDPHGYEKVISNIHFFQMIGVPVSLNFTIIQQNVMDYPKVGKTCQELGIPYTVITDITGHQYNKIFSEALSCRLSPAQRACLACHTPEDVEMAMKNAIELENELSDFLPPIQPEELTNQDQDSCIGSHTGCAIYWNGDMQTCISMKRYQCVKPFEIGFEAAWQKLKAKQDETFARPAACMSCEMSADCMHNCAGRRFEGTGSPHEPDPYICKYIFLLRRYRLQHNTTNLPLVPKCP